jgi:hypothetical protein
LAANVTGGMERWELQSCCKFDFSTFHWTEDCFATITSGTAVCHCFLVFVSEQPWRESFRKKLDGKCYI